MKRVGYVLNIVGLGSNPAEGMDVRLLGFLRIVQVAASATKLSAVLCLRVCARACMRLCVTHKTHNETAWAWFEL